MFRFQLACGSPGEIAQEEVVEDDSIQSGQQSSEFPPDPGPVVKDACSLGDCLKIEQGVELCQGFRKLKPDFQAALRKKAVLQLSAAELPLDNLKLRGEIVLGGKSVSFSGTKSKSKLEHFGQTALLTAEIQAHTPNKSQFVIRLLMTAKKTDSGLVYHLDSLEDLAGDYKQLSLVFDQPLELFGDARGAGFDACATGKSQADVFELQLAHGGALELMVQTRFTQQYKPSQYGLLKSAKGQVSGYSFDVSQWSELHHGTFRFSSSIQAPTLGVRFPPGAPAGGLGLIPTTDEARPYRAFLLDSDLSMDQELEILSTKIPERYGLLFHVDLD